jgi:hypothetical protein
MPPTTLRSIELLTVCARRRLNAAQTARVRALAADPELHWDAVLQAARRHKMLPLLAAHLQSTGAQLPPDVDARLRRYRLDNAQRVLAVTGELLVLLQELQSCGVQAVPYKGSVLALQLYGSLHLRPAGDMDIVVRRSDAAAAIRCLAGLGRPPAVPSPPETWNFRLRNRYCETLQGASTQVELHWAFTNRDIAFPLELEDVADRLGTVRISNRDVPVFPLDDLLLILCVHGAKHRWERLEWLAGVGEAVRSAQQMDWDGLVERASALGVRRMLLLGLLLSHEILDAPVPPDVVARGRADRHVASLAAEVPGILADPVLEAGAFSGPVDSFRYRLRERLRDRARFLAYRATTPSTPEEWRFLSIAGMQFPLHAVTRPFNLTGKALARLVSSGNGRS